MKKETLVCGVIGLIVGAVASGLIVNMNKSDAPVETMPMSNMVDSLKDKTDDDFDKAFLSGMITHHEDAIDMAKLAKNSAKHDDIKKMADDIISVQSKEIDMMRSWQSKWGYSTSTQDDSMMNDMDH